MPDDADNDEDISLMLKTAKGDVKAFTALVNKHKNSVVGTIGKMLDHSSDVEDIAQQVFIRIWKSAPSYEHSAKFTTWLYTITRNLVFNETRRLSRKKTISQDQVADEFGLELEDTSTPTPDDSLLRDELTQAVDKAIADLPEKARMAVILRRYENMPYEDIARILDISIPALKSLLHRARHQLKEALGSYLN